MAAVYIGSGKSRFPPEDPHASPMFATRSQLRKLPSTLFIVGDYELGLGDSTDMYARLVQAGHSDVSLSVYDRMFHCHVLYSEGMGIGKPLPAASRAIEEIKQWVAD